MKFDSPHFDRIRVKPDEDRRPRPAGPACEWPGCVNAGNHRAPKGRNRDKEYWNFCLAHAREYNQSYNFFSGMSDNDVAQYQKDSLTGHRPTWKIGMNGPISDATKRRGRAMPGMDDAADPFNVFQEVGGRGRRARPDPEHKAETRMIRNAERKAFDALGLENSATKADIKMRFKDLVKRHHPDANGGDRSTEDRLREVIQAYNYLKSVGFA
jgi:curved DNA-binding protein CbpA